MEIQNISIIEDGIEVPQSALLRAEHNSGYGSVPGLEDEELADGHELERQVMLDEWGPILALPYTASERIIHPDIDESGRMDWGAFGTVDFLREHPPFDKARYKADKLQEKLRTDLFMLDLVRERLRPDVRSRVRSLALHTRVELDDIQDPDERAYAKWLRRIRRLTEEIHRLREHSRQPRLPCDVNGNPTHPPLDWTLLYDRLTESERSFGGPLGHGRPAK